MNIHNFRYHLIQKVAKKHPWKFFYTGLIPQSIRWRLWRQWVDLYEQSLVAEKWKVYLDASAGMADELVANKKLELQGKNIIWQYWAQGLENAPPVAQLSYASVDYYAEGYQIIRLSDETVADYIVLPNFINLKRQIGDFKLAHYSDLLRVALLYAYGGVWLDSTIVLTAPLPLRYLNEEIFMFSRDTASPNKKLWGSNHTYFDWSAQSQVRHLNSLMIGQRGSAQLKLLQDLLLTYWQGENSAGHYFFFQILCHHLLVKKRALTEMPIVDDTLPHILSLIIDKELNAEQMEDIFLLSGIHKLSYANTLNKYIDGLETNFMYLRKNIFSQRPD